MDVAEADRRIEMLEARYRELLQITKCLNCELRAGGGEDDESTPLQRALEALIQRAEGQKREILREVEKIEDDLVA